MFFKSSMFRAREKLFLEVNYRFEKIGYLWPVGTSVFHRWIAILEAEAIPKVNNKVSGVVRKLASVTG